MKHQTKLLAMVAILLVALMMVTACAPATTAENTTDETATAAPTAEESAAVEETTDTPTETSQMKMLIGVGLGGLGDDGFNDAAYRGAQKAAEEFGIDMQVYEPKSYSENETQFMAAAKSGEYDLLIGVGYDKAEPIEKASQAYPDQSFALFQAVCEADNVYCVCEKIEEVGYTAGVYAASMMKNNLLPGIEGYQKIGVVLAEDTPEMRKEVYGFMAGAYSVMPELEVIVTATGDWTDQAKAKELALSLSEKGCGIVWACAGQAGLGVYEAAKETGVYTMSSGSNQNDFWKLGLCTTVDGIDAQVYNTIKSYVEGTFKGGVEWQGLKEGAVYLDFDKSNIALPDDVKAVVDQATEDIISGAISVPKTEDELNTFKAGLAK